MTAGAVADAPPLHRLLPRALADDAAAFAAAAARVAAAPLDVVLDERVVALLDLEVALRRRDGLVLLAAQHLL